MEPSQALQLHIPEAVPKLWGPQADGWPTSCKDAHLCVSAQ